MRKTYWAEHNERLDPEHDFAEIYRTIALYEFPWDFNQALSLALFRTYAVPSIGRLLEETGQFTGACQKRYDDTALLLEAPLVSGFDSTEGRSALRRVNQMHRRYDISDDDMRYVLSTFVVVPTRWIGDFGWRALSPGEVRASVGYYRELGRHLAVPDLPETYDDFARLMDDYEAEHFAHDPAARRVADATLHLMTTFYPRTAAPLVETFSRALMDPPLLAAFGYREPGSLVRRASTGALGLRARALALAPPRRRPVHAWDTPRIKSYPAGYDVASLGTFGPGGPATGTTADGPPRPGGRGL